MTLNLKLEQMCLSAYESWLTGEKSGEHGISVFTESEAGTQTTKRIFGQSRKDLVASARELAYTEAQRGLDAIVVYAEIVIGNESVLFEVIERNQETLQRYKLSGNAASDCFELTFIESISKKVFRHALWEAKCFGLRLYTRRAKKIQSDEFLNYCQSISKYTTSGELQNAVYLNRDTDISFALQLVPYNEAGECCVTFEIETFKANILALEATKELVHFCAEFDINFDPHTFIANWSERNLFEARRFQRMFGDERRIDALPEKTIEQFWTWNFCKSAQLPRIELIRHDGLVKSCVNMTADYSTFPRVDFVIMKGPNTGSCQILEVDAISGLTSQGTLLGLEVLSGLHSLSEKNSAPANHDWIQPILFSEIISTELLIEAKRLNKASKSILAPPHHWA